MYGIAWLRDTGPRSRVDLDDTFVYEGSNAAQLIAIDETLSALAKIDERQARIVELQFFAGMTQEEIAKLLRLSVRQVKRDWQIAKLWMYAKLRPQGP